MRAQAYLYEESANGRVSRTKAPKPQAEETAIPVAAFVCRARAIQYKLPHALRRWSDILTLSQE
jgi:hypothetical protein